LVPAKINLDETSDLRGIATVKWIGARTLHSPTDVLTSLSGAFHFVVENSDSQQKGLRQPQIGALHSILGYWTTDPKEPATVVMPTGTGKTETMLAVFAHERIDRLLVIVPSDALRNQIAAKFESFGVLQDAGVIEQRALRPVVGQVRHRINSPDAAIRFAQTCNVIVATPSALSASSLDVREVLTAQFSHLFVDEAHHVAATTWREIRDAFDGKPVIQFTATPFREDGRHLGGRLLYAFPLREAQRQEYFSEIQYRSIITFNDSDREISKTAVAQLRSDIDAGYDHLLMARVRRISRATELLGIYQEIAGDLNPVVIHSRFSAAEKRQSLARINSRESRIIICVDMLGEGFDLPSLKVAAIHDPHKSLGVTLQFVGRFARVTGTALGPATVIVGRPEMEYDDTLRTLYAEDADWNIIIRDLSEKAVGYQQAVSEFEEAFGTLSDSISIRSLLPKMSTVVYRTMATNWQPGALADLFGEGQLITLPIPVNERDRVAWFVTELHGAVRWGDVRSLQDVSHDLYVLFWDETRRLLYINSSDTESVHEELAKCICGDDVMRIRGENVFRVMAHVKRLVPTNVGVLDIRNRARRFSMYVGADVTEGFPVARALTKTKTNIFAYGFEEGKRISIGASLKGRIWSHRIAPSLKHWMDWCNEVGSKLVDDSINIDEVMGSFIRPKVIDRRPQLVALAAEWPWDIFLSTSEEIRIDKNGSNWPLVDADVVIASNTTRGPISFDIVTPDWTARYEAVFGQDSIIYQTKESEVIVVGRHTSVPLSAFLTAKGLVFLLEQDATIVHPGLLLQPDRELSPFDRTMLESLDWSGINLRKESQGPNCDPDSVQARVLAHLLTIADWDIVIDDDGSGEIADLVALLADGQELRIMLVHCKFSKKSRPGARIEDLYEVCGQAQKSGRWQRSPDHMFRHLIRREKNRIRRNACSGFMKGDASTLHDLHSRARLLRSAFTIVIAQPGLSKADVSISQLELLASTEVYLRETANAPLGVYCNA